MSLPNWFQDMELEAERLRQRLQSEAQAKAPSYAIRDSFHTAPGWRDLGQEYSCVPDAVYPWDPLILKAIWEFDPRVVPIWVRWAFLSPSDASAPHVKVYGRHALGLRTRTPKRDLALFNVNMPQMPCQGVKFERPNEIFLLWTNEDDAPDGSRPGSYKPFDMRLVQVLRESYVSENTGTKELKQRYIWGRIEAEAKAAGKRQEEAAYRKRDLDRFVDKMLDKVSEVEVAEWYKGRKHRQPERKPTTIVP